MCLDCNEIITVGNSGSDGWSPVLALYEGTCGETSVTVQQLVSWIDGTGTKPDYDGNIMTDAWLAANPIYIGTTGFVTDICDAVPLNGGSGSTGATGPAGPEGPQGDPGEPGCTPIAELNFEFTNNTEALNPPVETTVTIDNTDPCAPIYDVSIDANELFANEGLADVLIGTTAFQDALSNNTAINPTPSYKSTNGTGVGPLTIGVSTEDIQYSGTTLGNLSFESSMTSYVQHSIIGNTMYLNFRLYLTTGAAVISSNDVVTLYMVIPDGRESYNDLFWSSITCVRYVEKNSAIIPTPGSLITAASGNDRVLRFGICDANLDTSIILQNGEGVHKYYFAGQIALTLKSI